MTLPLSKIPSNVKESFVKIGDEIDFYPLFNKKRTLKLNRTNLQIIERNGSFTANSHEVSLPAIGDRHSNYEINHKMEIDHEYFLLTAKSGHAFKINGVWAREAYLFRGDEVIIGHNKILFKKKSNPDILPELLNARVIKDIPLLLEGETGTGKSTIAKKIHQESGVVGDFVQINISSYPASLLESELFGHVKGAFTGAFSEKSGAIKAAMNGTLFIDEIDSLPLDIQTKLLLFLDNKKIRPVGSSIEIQCNLNLIFASGQKLEMLVEKGVMRKDFYFRIASGQKINLKSLREDKVRIITACRNFERENEIRISDDLLNFYLDYNWPGNLRQLHGHLKKKMLLANSKNLKLDDIDFNLLDIDLIQNSNILQFRDFKSVRRGYFLAAYHRFGKNIKLTAKSLKVAEATIKAVLDIP